MGNLEQLLAYDAIGIIPRNNESELSYILRAEEIVANTQQFKKYLDNANYSKREIIDAEKESLKSFEIDKGYGIYLNYGTEQKFWKKLPFFGAICGIAEYYAYGSMLMGFGLGYLVNRIGMHAYNCHKAKKEWDKYTTERNLINTNQMDIEENISNEFPMLFSYITERMTHEDWVAFSSCKNGKELKENIEQKNGVKWKIIREKIRRTGVQVGEKPQEKIIEKQPIKWLWDKTKYLTATLISAALFFETSYGYRDVIVESKGISKQIKTEVQSLKQLMTKENKLSDFSEPKIEVGYRAMHHTLFSETQNMLETVLPIIKTPGIKQACQVYTYIGGGILCGIDSLKGLYSPCNQSLVVMGNYNRKGIDIEERYALVHEIGHHYIHIINPNLTMTTVFSKSSLENSLLHEGLADNIAINTFKKEYYVKSRQIHHRCMYISDLAKYMGGKNEEDILLQKSHHYAFGQVFANYVLEEIGKENINTFIKNPPKFLDYIYSEKYVLDLKKKLKQKPELKHKHLRSELEKILYHDAKAVSF